MLGLQAHSAPLGIAFENQAAKQTWPKVYQSGFFAALHGSWNRKPAAGYKVVFVRLQDGEAGKAKPIDVVTGFLDPQGNAPGRPVDVPADAQGALLVRDDVGGDARLPTAGVTLDRDDAPGSQPPRP